MQSITSPASVRYIYGEVRSHFKEVGQLEFLNIIQVVNNELEDTFDAINDSMLTLSVTEGVQYYSLPDNVLRIWGANYQTDSTTYTQLQPTSVDKLDEEFANWRFIAVNNPSQPTLYYTNGNQFGVYCSPNQTTSGGYPVINVYVRQATTVLDMDTSLPTPVRNADAWIYKICYNLSLKYAPEKADAYYKAAERAKQDQIKYMQGRVARELPTLKMRVPQVYGPG